MESAADSPTCRSAGSRFVVRRGQAQGGLGCKRSTGQARIFAIVHRFLIVLLVALSSGLLSQPAGACSGPIDDTNAARVLVVGRIERIDLVRSELQPPSKDSSIWYRKLVTMQVTQVYKGAPPSTLRYWDAGIAQYLTAPDGTRRISWGGGGDCSTIEDDVTGRYMAVALGGDPHALSANILFGSLLMDGPIDLRVAGLLTRYGFTLPATSTR